MEKRLKDSSILELDKTASLKQSVLLIEDHNDLRELYKIVLEQGGFDVFTAENGLEAIATLSEIDQPDLILLDMQLGDMTGTELLTLLEENSPEITEKVPVVFLTGMNVVPISKVIGFIHKPVDVDKLIELTHHFIKIGTANARNKH